MPREHAVGFYRRSLILAASLATPSVTVCV